MMATERKKQTQTQLNVMITKETRTNLNKVMINGDVETQADAVALALRIAAEYLTEHKESRE